MSRSRLPLLLVAAVVLLSVTFGREAHAAPRTLRFAAQAVGSTAYERTAAMANVMNSRLPAGWSVEVQPISTGGLAGTLLTEGGAVDMAEGINVSNVLLRSGNFVKDGQVFSPPTRAVSILGGTDFGFYMVMFTEAFRRRSGCDTLEQVIAAKIPFTMVTKAPGSAGELGASQLLNVLGVNYSDIRARGGAVFRVAPNRMADMLRQGTADMSIDIVGLGQSAMVSLTQGTDMYFPQLEDDTLCKLMDFGYAPKVMPAASWRGQGRDLRTVVNSTAYVVDSRLPENVVYAMVKALCESKAELVRQVPTMEQYDPVHSGDPALNGLTLHPGAVRYYQEMGYRH